VLLPFVKSSERKRKAKAADDSRAAMLSKSLDQSHVIQPSAQSGDTGDASSAVKRPPSATAQAILEKERAHSARPKSAKTANAEALQIKENHAIEMAKAGGQGATRPQSREGVRPTSRGPPSRAEARPPSQANDARPPSSSTLTSGSKPTGGLEADAASPLAKSATAKDLSLAKSGTAKDLSLSKSGTKKDLAASPATIARGGTKKDLAGALNERKGGRGRRGAPTAADPAAPAGGGGGGVDSAVVEAMQAELDAYKAAETRLKERLRDKDAQIHELTHKVFYLNDELNGAKDRQGKMMAGATNPKP